MRSKATTKTRKWAMVATLTGMLLAAAVAFGEAQTPCEIAYLTSGPTAQQPSFASGCEHAV